MKQYAAEFIGTFWLVLGGCGSAVLAAAFPDVGIGLLGVSLAFGLTVLTMAFAIGHSSGCHLSPAVSDAVLSDYRKHVTDPIDLLTSREREVLQMIAEGQTNKEIATRLNLSVYTVEAHRGRIMEKLNLHSTGELVRFAIRNGLID